jgi:hypothetical protein
MSIDIASEGLGLPRADSVASRVNVARCEYSKSFFLERSELVHRDVLGRAALIRVERSLLHTVDLSER